MNKKMILTKLYNVRMGFYFEDSKLQAINCYENDSIIGNIYVARVSNVLKNINACFVDIKSGESCYLSLEDFIGQAVPKVGNLVLVQVIKDKIKTKQATVTTKISITGENIIVHLGDTIGISKKITDAARRASLKELVRNTIQEFEATHAYKEHNFGCIIRTGAQTIDDKIIQEETIKILCELHEIIHQSKYRTAYSCMKQNTSAYITDYLKLVHQGDCEIITDDDEFIQACKAYNLPIPTCHFDQTASLDVIYSLNSNVTKALNTRAYLKCGGYLVIEHTEAMTVIDVNSGKAITGANCQNALLKMNLEAAAEISRQLRIRNISGIIIVDFINLKSERDKTILLQAFREYVANDWVDVTVHDITKLGLVEVTRKKVHKPIYEIIKNT
ncbi:MAG: ribonuclease E/G [Eubacteriales bacterium]|nr:ribonuclease E/G [Eubacteriales bacterium]